jgi:hypothetical protein
MRRIVLVGALAMAGCEASAGATEVPDRTPVLVELFTSQGCSSCPPADRLLRELAEDEDLDIVPLAFHVDYWNYIGWKDPFSDAQWSARQRAYATAARSSRVYTPQLLFDGHEHNVGRNGARARAAIAEESRRGAARLSIEQKNAAAGIEVEISVAGEASRGAAVFVALARDAASTDVRRGENAGRELANAFIVTAFDRACAFEAGGTCSVVLPRAEVSSHVVAFVQSPSTMRVFGVASAPAQSSDIGGGN